MKRVTDSPMLRGKFDILHRRRRIKFSGEFPITLTNVGRLSAENWIMKTKTACIGMRRFFKLTQSNIPEMIIDGKLDRQNQDPLMQQCGDLEYKSIRFSRNEYRENAHTLGGKIPSIHEATTAAPTVFN